MGPHVAPAEAIRQPVGLHGWLVDAILCGEVVNQRWVGGCSVSSSQTTTRGGMGEAATILIAATRKDRRGRTRTTEPVGIHRSSFGEDKGGGVSAHLYQFRRKNVRRN
jgi:hypothetical protein